MWEEGVNDLDGREIIQDLLDNVPESRAALEVVERVRTSGSPLPRSRQTRVNGATTTQSATDGRATRTGGTGASRRRHTIRHTSRKTRQGSFLNTGPGDPRQKSPIARAQQEGVVFALAGRRADQSGIGEGPFRPGSHFGNVAYASFADLVSSSTPASCRRASSERG